MYAPHTSRGTDAPAFLKAGSQPHLSARQARMSTQRLRIDLAYDGTDFSGWARQPGLRTVQDELETGLTRILGRNAEPVSITVAGRTDAGVHAHHTVTHTDVPTALWKRVPGRSERTPEIAALSRLAGVLPRDIVVRSITPVPTSFDARFSALHRRYLYRLCDNPPLLDPLRRRDTVLVSERLDVDALNAASALLVGLRDFAALCKKRPYSTTIRTLQLFAWERLDEGTVVAHVQADAFCHSMVRALVGALVPVGHGKREIEWPSKVVASQEKNPGVVVMPAHGLSLMHIAYPELAEVGERAKNTRARRVLPLAQPNAQQTCPAPTSPEPGQT
ncbi:putative dehydrogenase (putative aldehyde dehydrogenase) [Platysternon megacephalum]|uniref:tRNA pseudouridine synthase n=1 Tax=Platysternon megacephalum TaxID=55544 RepID=A0A4D9DDZ3_9SAUR|nr:putative dehydrogenase (putative aldehyde dehydrogenase) [Platysternon megacephalum]